MLDWIIIGFLIGTLVGGWFASYFIKVLKKNKYIKFEATDKLHNELKKLKMILNLL